MKVQSQKEIANRLGVTLMSIHRWLREGLPHERVGMSYIFDLGKVADWLEQFNGRKHLAAQLRGEKQ